MITEIILPKLGETMEEGAITKWFKAEGETVNKGEPLFEVTTDKASIEVESPATGILRKVIYKPSEEPIKVLKVVGFISENIEESVPEYTQTQKQPNTAQSTVELSGNRDTISKISQKTDGNMIISSPISRKLANEMGIDISNITGTGPNGRITEKDVNDYLSNRANKVPEEIIKTTNVRRIIADRLVKSKFIAPHFYITIEINMDKAVRLREEIRLSDNQKISFNDIMIKAVAIALKNFPYLNGEFHGKTIKLKKEINIGIAVATEEGLSVPVIKNANQKTLIEISNESKQLIDLSKNNKVSLEDMEQGTFTISNLGMYDIDSFTAIINPPQAGILAIGSIKETPVVRSGQVVAGYVMKITLSADHRIVDGAYGASFLKEIKNILENPETLK